jgi:hypothetical protein
MNLVWSSSNPLIKQRALDDFMPNSFRRHRNQFPPISSTRSSSSITPAATIASTSATVKRRRGRP